MIDKLLFWNIRLVKTQKAFERLIDLNRRHHYSFISLLEPFQEATKINNYTKRLGFEKVLCNTTSKIWIFCSED